MTDLFEPTATRGQGDEREHLDCFFYSEAEAADRLGIHRTTLRTLALAGKSPVEPVHVTEHRRLYRRIDIHRLAGLDT